MMIRRLLYTSFICISFASVSQAAIMWDLFIRLDPAGSPIDGLDLVHGVAPGVSFPGAELVLRETVSAPDLPVIGAGGVASVAVDIASAGGSGSFSSLTPDADFDITGGSDGDTIIGLQAGIPLIGLPFTTTVLGADTIYETVLGTVTLTAPGALNEQTVFSLADNGPGALDDFFAVDPLSPPFGTVDIPDNMISFRSVTLSTVTAIPEPSGFAALMLLGGVCMRRRRR